VLRMIIGTIFSTKINNGVETPLEIIFHWNSIIGMCKI